MQVFNYAICVIWGVCKKNQPNLEIDSAVFRY